MNGYDGPEARCAVVAEHDLLVPVLIHQIEDSHHSSGEPEGKSEPALIS